MSNNINNDIVVRPIDCLAEKSIFTAFICEEYPSSCNECLYGWFSNCQISTKEKEKTYGSTKRPTQCPLIKPEYYNGNNGRYPILSEAEWSKRNPILTDHSIVISGDLSKIKIGNGKDNYCSLPFLTLINKSEIQEEMIYNITPKTNIDLSLEECNILYSLCDHELANIQNKIDDIKSKSNLQFYSTNSVYIDSLNKRMFELITLKFKISTYIENKEK